MIEIKFSGKTYIELIPRYTASDIQNWIAEGFLEEVKENKEYSSINEFCVLNGVSEEHRVMLNTFLAIEHTKANSILEKLREELETRKEYNETKYLSGCGDEYRAKMEAFGIVLGLLTSLEQSQTKEEPQTIIQEELEKAQESNTTYVTTWTPTPGQMIEVSVNGKDKWVQVEFVRMLEKSETKHTCPVYLCRDWSRMDNEEWTHARPLPQEDIELLPGWELDREGLSDSDLIDCMNKQLVGVTDRLNQLIKANKKPL